MVFFLFGSSYHFFPFICFWSKIWFEDHVLATMLYNESKHNILAFLVGKANKLNKMGNTQTSIDNIKHL